MTACRAALLLLCLGTAVVDRARAQFAPPPQPEPTAMLRIGIDQRGKGVIHFLVSTPRNDPAFPEAIERSLGGPLRDVQTSHTLGRAYGLQAHADGVLTHRPAQLALDGTIDPGPLLKALRPHGVKKLSVVVIGPEVGLASVLSRAMPNQAGALALVPGPLPVENCTFDTADDAPEPIRLAYGYEPADLLRLLPPLAVLLLGVAFTFGARHHYRGRAEKDPAAAFDGLWCFTERLTALIWLAWLASLGAAEVGPLAFFLAPGDGGAVTFAGLAAILFVPPALAVVLARAVAAPVFACVPEVGWTRSVVLRRALFGQAALVVPLIVLAAGIGFLLTGHPGRAALTALAALLTSFVLLVVWISQRGRPTILLTQGPVRDRAYELAEDATQKLRGMVLVGPSEWRLLGTLGMIGELIHVTPPVLEQLSRRQVDALLAHELTYLGRKNGRMGWHYGVGVVVLWALWGLLSYLWLRGHIEFERWWPAALGLVAVPYLASFFAGRPYGPRFDGPSLALSRDPEALITALARLGRLRLLPLAGRGTGTDEASLRRRLEAIADRADIPDDRLDEILARDESNAERYPPLPADVTGLVAPPTEDAPVLTPAVRGGMGFRLVFLLIAVHILLPALVALAAQRAEVQGLMWLAVYLLGLAVTWVGRRFTLRWQERRWLQQLRHRLQARLTRLGQPVPADGLFVGLAPGEHPGFYGGLTEWDLGFLALGESLVYVGDQARFALRREQIVSITLGPGALSDRRHARVHLVWRRDDESPPATLTFSRCDNVSRWPWSHGERALLERLTRWWQSAAPAGPSAVVSPELGPPKLPRVPADPRSAIVNGAGLVFVVTLTALPALILAYLLGLDFPLSEGGAAWYAVLAAIVTLVVPLLDTWYRYRPEPTDPAETGATLG